MSTYIHNQTEKIYKEKFILKELKLCLVNFVVVSNVGFI